MFGYATDETDECMPLTVVLAHALNERLAICRRDGTLPWARPDSKSQVRHDAEILKGGLNFCYKAFVTFRLQWSI